jgi:shikimate dehydrogenase
MHNAGFEALGQNAVYVPLEAADIADFRRFAAETDLRGASVTIPFKVDAMSLADDVSPLAKAVGAVNTIGRSQGRWSGTNTDVDGFLEPLKRRTDVRGLRAMVLGAGGAARAVAFGLVREGATVAIAARRPEAAETIALGAGAHVAEWPPRADAWDLLVNATPIGSRALPGSPIDLKTGSGKREAERGKRKAGSGPIVYDLVYTPDPTELMTTASAAGCAVIGGIEMLVAQAEQQFEFWTGHRPPAGLFAEAAAQAIRKRES